MALNLWSPCCHPQVLGFLLVCQLGALVVYRAHSRQVYGCSSGHEHFCVLSGLLGIWCTERKNKGTIEEMNYVDMVDAVQNPLPMGTRCTKPLDTSCKWKHVW